MDRLCGFCRVLAGEAAGSFLYRDERVAALMDLVPVNPGHLLVVPVRHAIYLSNLDPEDGSRMFRVAQELAAPWPCAEPSDSVRA
jgi:histidine triad (HIT) family protein